MRAVRATSWRHMTATEQIDALKVFISNRDSSCEECGEELGRKAWITLVDERGAVCLACADLDHLVFLPSSLKFLPIFPR